MRVLCAWCVKEGKPALIGEKEPLDDPTETHGLCPDHRRHVEEDLARYRAEAEVMRNEAEALRRRVDP